MAKNLKKFAQHTQYEQYTGTTYLKPNVSYCQDVRDVHYNNKLRCPITSVTVSSSATTKASDSFSWSWKGENWNRDKYTAATYTVVIKGTSLLNYNFEFLNDGSISNCISGSSFNVVSTSSTQINVSVNMVKNTSVSGGMGADCYLALLVKGAVSDSSDATITLKHGLSGAL